ncbi:RING-H2 finger protein ATL33-like [Cornus florida]|uniref:RING-H2 finger protein ATL33-like n=1 Tax=Cornus florida TaxID=4283 RepID=UPI0028A2CAD4|nr:RING-H2 finger protein ATL33-like [Cornus florida]
MSTTPTVPAPIPSPATHTESYDISPIAAVLSLLALVGIPVLIYAFFFAIKCPRDPFSWLHRSSGENAGELTGRRGDSGGMELIPVVKYKEEAHGKEHGSECPVCLSVFSDGEEIRQVKPCKHLFHTACIDMWLYSHSNCPVCRASIAGIKHPKRPVVQGDDDLRQGLPDSSSLV